MFHQCFILTEQERNVENKSEKKFNGYIFFDYECMTSENSHVPNLIVVDKVCCDCLDEKICQNNCKIHKFTSNDEFCLWLLQQDYYIAIAHNLRAYDGVFIMKYLTQNPIPKEKISVLLSGTKLITIQVQNVKIIDSFNYIHMSLAKFPATFQIQ